MSWDLELLKRALQIRYVKLRFGLRIAEDTRLPVNKVSAIRGGIGEMLLRANCIRDRQCKSCDFESECIVRRTLYSRFEEGTAWDMCWKVKIITKIFRKETYWNFI